MPIVRDIMQRDVMTVSSADMLSYVERLFTDRRISGAPVVEGERLVGVVSLSDISSQMVVEQSLAEIVSDWYRDPGAPQASVETVAALVAPRIATRKVCDVMTRHIIRVAPDATVQDAARVMVQHGTHRVLVTLDDRLEGIVTTTDILRVVANGSLPPPHASA